MNNLQAEQDNDNQPTLIDILDTTKSIDDLTAENFTQTLQSMQTLSS